MLHVMLGVNRSNVFFLMGEHLHVENLVAYVLDVSVFSLGLSKVLLPKWNHLVQTLRRQRSRRKWRSWANPPKTLKPASPPWKAAQLPNAVDKNRRLLRGSAWHFQFNIFTVSVMKQPPLYGVWDNGIGPAMSHFPAACRQFARRMTSQWLGKPRR